MADTHKDSPIIITVWDHEGNIVEKIWEGTWDEYDLLCEKYEDDPGITVDYAER